MNSHNTEEFLGVDVGGARVGIARGNSAARLAEPLKTVAAPEALKELLEVARQNHASGIVVGLPRSIEGDDTPQTKSVRSWAHELKKLTNLKLYWQDEALTSQAAETKNVNPALGSDAYAAAIILQDFLDNAESDRVAI